MSDLCEAVESIANRFWHESGAILRETGVRVRPGPDPQPWDMVESAQSVREYAISSVYSAKGKSE